MGYGACIRCGWKTGVHDCRFRQWQHPWLAVHRPSGRVVGCWSKAEARRVLKDLKQGVR